jgi:hypothetical protein
MTRDERRRQKSLARKTAKRKNRKHSLNRQTLLPRARALPPGAAHWPVYECLVTRDWDQPGELVQILIARSSPAGEIAAAVVLMDLGSLGVKNAFANYFPLQRDYEELRESLRGRQPMVRADFNLVAKIIREGINYAKSLGFSPHRDYREAEPFLRDADPDSCRKTIPLGIDGKPYFVSGPYDDVPRIMRTLAKAVGPGNFEYTVGVESLDVLDLDD